ncbi:MAG: deoxyribonuclease IV [Phycisphaerales bacterium]
MFGSHLSIAGSMVNALHEAEGLGLDTVQVFTKNQQQWKAKPLDPGIVQEWRAELKRLGWVSPGRTVSHASYLINLAAPDDELWRKSIDLMTDEIGRCETLGIPFLVHHPGAYTTSSAQAGIARIAAAYKNIFARTRGYATVSCLEDTVGAGSILGRTLEELAAMRAAIIDATGEADRVGFCLDTCHLHAGGYDMSTRAGADAVLDEFFRQCGPGTLRVMHVNDSKFGLGSRRDWHAHLGEGAIGTKSLKSSGFAAVVNRPELRETPKILETPKGTNPAGKPYDALNLQRLKRLADREPINYRPPARRAASKKAPRR